MAQTYSKQDGELLIEYYSDLLIGKPLMKGGQEIITGFSLEPFSEGQFRAMAHATVRTSGIHDYRRDIFLVARDLELKTPDDVLKEKRQSSS